MNKKALTIILCAALAATLLPGCSKKEPEASAENVSEENVVESEEAPEKVTKPENVGERTAKINVAKEPEKSEESEESEEPASPDIVKNTGHFVFMDGKIYFHIPDADSMGRSTLWAEYADTECGRTILVSYDPATEEVENVAYDYSSGSLGVHQNGVYSIGYTASADGQSYVGKSLDKYSSADGMILTELQAQGDSLLGVSKSGSYVATLHSDYINSQSVNTVSVFRDGVLSASYDLDHYYGCVGLGENQIFYIFATSENFFMLRQLDITTGDIIDLGPLPNLMDTDWCGYVDEFIVDDENVYFTYSSYQGTGNFFTEGYYVWAKINQPDSAKYSEMPTNMVDGDPRFAPFAVIDGQMTFADGEPGTCAVNTDGDLGYYDEQGKWQKVTSGWETEYDTQTDDYSSVELAELVGDSIYLIYNNNQRAPQDDIGWRYAYYRNSCDVFKVSVETGEAVRLVHQVGPGGE